jgi:hypothetical protein
MVASAGVMGKGTLQDILSDEKVTLDDMFKSSMIGDAAKVIICSIAKLPSLKF